MWSGLSMGSVGRKAEFCNEGLQLISQRTYLDGSREEEGQPYNWKTRVWSLY